MHQNIRKIACTVCSLAMFMTIAPQGTFLFPDLATAAQTSDLWGTNGKLWEPAGRITDYSFAGYRTGNVKIPTLAQTTDVRKFGARGDGSTDDTAAIQAAIDATSHGAVFLPAGRYKISRPLKIVNKSNFVLRGAGKGKTVILPDRPVSNDAVPYGWIGMIAVEGEGIRSGNTVLVSPTQNAARGDRTLRVRSTAGFSPGQMIELREYNPTDNSLGCHVYLDVACMSEERLRGKPGGQALVVFYAWIESVGTGTITLNRPLPIDIRSEWRPEIRHVSIGGSGTEVGIEDFTLQFPPQQYGGHDLYAGYYGIYFSGMANSWVRNVTITDADRGIELFASAFNTVTNVTLNTAARVPVRLGSSDFAVTGHYGFAVGGGSSDNLIQNSSIDAVFDHNMSVTGATGNVFSNIVSWAPVFDNHGYAPRDNLWTQITLTKTLGGLFASGGCREEPNGVRPIVWNIKLLSEDNSVSGGCRIVMATLVGVPNMSTSKPGSSSTDAWVESWPGEQTTPPNLYLAQLERRGEGIPLPSSTPTTSPTPVGPDAVVKPLQEDLPFDAAFTLSEVCPFDVQVAPLSSREIITTFFDRRGDVAMQLITGPLKKVEVINLDTGESLVLNLPDAGRILIEEDRATFLQEGPWLTIVLPGAFQDDPDFAGLSLTKGKVVSEFDPGTGEFLGYLSSEGEVVDLCAALAS
jgi:hypothetical protein